MAGFVYVLSNPSFTAVKIGKSDRDPSNRVSELSNSTGIPTPFKLEYYAFVTDHHDLERWCHVTLATKRVSKNREFFEVTVVEAIECIRSIAGTGLKFEENHYARWKDYEKEKLKAQEARRVEAERKRLQEAVKLKAEEERRRKQEKIDEKWQLLNDLLDTGETNSRQRATRCISRVTTKANRQKTDYWIESRVESEKLHLERALRNAFTSADFLSTAKETAITSFNESATCLIFHVEKFSFETNHLHIDDLERVIQKVYSALRSLEIEAPIREKSIYLSIRESFELIKRELKRSEKNFPLRVQIYEERYPLLKRDLFILCQSYFSSEKPQPGAARQLVRSAIYDRYSDASQIFSIFSPKP